MAKMTVKGFKEVENMLDTLGKKSGDVAKKALYEGAGVAFNYVATALADIPTDDHFGTSENPKDGPMTIQKHGLQKALGIAPFREDGGTVDTSIGFDGYNSVKTERFPSGEPNEVVARRVERGTSYMRGNKFMSQAKKEAKAPIEKTMKQVVQEEIQKLTK